MEVKELNKKYGDLVFSDDFMFKKVMEDPEICKGVLERILCVKIGSIRYHETEKTMKQTNHSKGIRLDVYLSDGKTKYDIEMQTTPQNYIYSRSRYYLGIMEEDSLSPGQSYSQLGDNIVIFICMADPFDLNLCRYTIRDHVDEQLDYNLGTETKKVFLNVSGDMSHESPEMVSFFNYITKQEVPDGDGLIKLIDNKVVMERRDPDARKEYLNMIGVYNDAMIAGRERGLEEGRAAGMSEGMSAGMSAGKAKGERLQLIKSICHMRLNGQSSENIASILGESEDEIGDICNAMDNLNISDCSEDSVNRIYDELQSGKFAKA